MYCVIKLNYVHEQIGRNVHSMYMYRSLCLRTYINILNKNAMFGIQKLVTQACSDLKNLLPKFPVRRRMSDTVLYIFRIA